MIRRITIAVLALVIATSAAADKPPAIELGFKADKVYSFGSLDNVNLFNGNMIFTIPLGLKYPVSSSLSYGLTLVYNSKAWDYYYVESWQDPRDVRAWAKPNIRSNAGMGWRVSLGRLIPPSSPTATTGYLEANSQHWVYEGPAGDEHSFPGTVGVIHATDSSNDYGDGSRIRMVYIDAANRDIQFPNGEVHRFVYERNSWRIKRMADAFNNAITITYGYVGTSDRTATWSLTDGAGRTQVITFINSLHLSETIDRGQMVANIKMTGFGAAGTTNLLKVETV